MEKLLTAEIDLICGELELIRRRLDVMRSVLDRSNMPYDPATNVVTMYGCPASPDFYWSTSTCSGWDHK